LGKVRNWVIAAGGDGTVSAVAAAVLQTDIPLGIIPRGTANAVATALGIPTNLQAACEIITNGHTRLIDAATSDHHLMVLLAGIGLEANIVAQADRGMKDRLGVAGYLISAMQQLGNIEKFATTLETENRIINVQATAITVANIAPSTSVLAQGPPAVVPDDGFLDVTIFSPDTAGEALSASYRLFQSALENAPVPAESVGYFRCQALTISTDPEQNVVIDGEVTGTTPVHIRCLEKALKVIVPESATEIPSEKLEGLPDLTIEPKEPE
jgi:YegS/Rv2252/BmrU family lipid kinase